MKKSILPYLFSTLLLVILIIKTDISSLKNINEFFFNKYIICSIIVSVLFYNILAAFKLGLITAFSGFKTGFNKMFYYEITNYILKFVFPFKLGEVIKIFTFSRITNISLSISTSFLVFDKIISVIIMFLYLIYGFSVKEFIYNFKTEVLFLCFILILVILLIILPYIKKILLKVLEESKINNLFITLDRIKFSNKLLILIMTAVFQLADYFIAYLVLIAFGVSIPLKIFFPIMTIIILGSTIPFAVAGFGVRESLFVFFFRDFADKSILFYSGFMLSFIGHFIPAFVGVFFTYKILPHLKIFSEFEKIKMYLRKV